jgi:hypothetical protein
VSSSRGTDFRDIPGGKSGSYSAVTGYDLVTGWGSPNGQGLINAGGRRLAKRYLFRVETRNPDSKSPGFPCVAGVGDSQILKKILRRYIQYRMSQKVSTIRNPCNTG